MTTNVSKKSLSDFYAYLVEHLARIDTYAGVYGYTMKDTPAAEEVMDTIKGFIGEIDEFAKVTYNITSEIIGFVGAYQKKIIKVEIISEKGVKIVGSFSFGEFCFSPRNAQLFEIELEKKFTSPEHLKEQTSKKLEFKGLLSPNNKALLAPPHSKKDRFSCLRWQPEDWPDNWHSVTTLEKKEIRNTDELMIYSSQDFYGASPQKRCNLYYEYPYRATEICGGEDNAQDNIKVSIDVSKANESAVAVYITTNAQAERYTFHVLRESDKSDSSELGDISRVIEYVSQIPEYEIELSELGDIPAVHVIEYVSQIPKHVSGIVIPEAVLSRIDKAVKNCFVKSNCQPAYRMSRTRLHY